MSLLQSATVVLSHANLSQADLRWAILREVNLQAAISLKDTDLRGVKGLTKEQLEACKAKGAIIDEDATTDSSQSPAPPSPSLQSNDGQAHSAPPAQVSVPPPGTDESSTTSSKSDSGA